MIRFEFKELCNAPGLSRLNGTVRDTSNFVAVFTMSFCWSPGQIIIIDKSFLMSMWWMVRTNDEYMVDGPHK